MRSEFLLALQQLADEKGIQIDAVLNSLRTAVATAFQDMGTEYDDIDVEISVETGEATIYANKTVVEDVTDPVHEISLEESRGYDEEVELGEVFQIEITPPNFGRIGVQNARYVMQQAIRDAERMEIYQQFIEHQGEILVGRVSRVENRGVYVELGRAESILLGADQIPSEYYRVGQRLRVLLLEVSDGGRGAQLRVSRSHPDFVRRLFEREVPEIQNGIVEIMGIARDAGVRTKVAVRSLQEALDPVGSCVGMRGTRIQNILRELGQEKVEIIQWAAEPSAYVANSLSPARVRNVHIDLPNRVADVFVGSDMVSLAIGREGQNSRLAARLTGFRINIRDASEPSETRDVAEPDDGVAADETAEDAEPAAELASDELVSAQTMGAAPDSPRAPEG